MAKLSKVDRKIDAGAIRRAGMVDDRQIGPYLDQIATELHMRLDQWRFHGAPPGDVDTCLDAFLALWTEAEARGFA